MNSTAPSTAPRCSISRLGLPLYAGSAIRPPPCSSAASPQLEGGVEALCVSSGQAALYYAVLNLAELGRNIVSVPQLYGTTYTLFAHILPKLGIRVRFAKSDRADGHRGADRRRTRAPSSARRSAIRPATSATSRRSPTWPTGTACR